jgi:hypothetical protein
MVMAGASIASAVVGEESTSKVVETAAEVMQTIMDAAQP